jgi:hypothetical protein
MHLMDDSPVPESWVKAADDLFIAKLLGSRLSQPVRLAELIFDSFSEALPEGVRAESPRRLVRYSCEDCSVDLQIDASAGSDDTVPVGQIAVRGESPDRLAGKPIVVLHRGRLLAQTTLTSIFHR